MTVNPPLLPPALHHIGRLVQPLRRRKVRTDAAVVAVTALLLLVMATVVSPFAVPWVTGVLEAGIFCLTCCWVQRCVWTKRPVPAGRSFFAAACIPLLGVFQVATGVTVYGHATREAILYWSAMCCLLLVANSLCWERLFRNWFVLSLVALTAVVAVINMTGIAEFGDLRAITEDSGWKSLGQFASSNQYAELIELALPVALAKAVLDRRRWLFYAVLSAILYATVIGSRSRMGSLLVTAELAAVPLCARAWSLGSIRHCRKLSALLLVLAVVATLAVGAGGLFARLQSTNPLAGRSEIFAATWTAIRQHPVSGFGLGTFSTIYPSFAVADLGGIVSHAHDEWLEALSDGGFPLVVILLALFVPLIRPAARSLWGLGLIAILIHGAVDFPLQRFGICAWTFVVAGALEGARRAESIDLPGFPARYSTQGRLRSPRH